MSINFCANPKSAQLTSNNQKMPISTIAKTAAVVMACFILLGALHLFEVHGLPPAQISNITTDPGQEFFPVVSNDGRYVAYVWHRIGRPSDLYIKDLNEPTKAPRQLTFDDKMQVRPVWHPNAKKLYFAQKAWNDQQCNLIELTLASATQKIIARCPADINVSLAITRRVELLIEDIFILDINTKNARQLTFGQGDILGLIWHPDGDRIVYGMEEFGAREGYVVDVSSGKTDRLEVPGLSFSDFIPASQRLAFISNESGHNEAYSSKLNGDDRRQLTHLNTNLYSVSWSHDGQSIAFIGPRADKQGNNLLVLNVNTLKIQKLDSPFNEHKRPSWTWDDKTVMTATNSNNQQLLYAFSIDGGPPTQLLQQSVRFAVQTTDQTLWFSTDNQGIWRYQPNQPNTPPVQVLTKADFDISYNWRFYFHQEQS